MCVNTSRFTRKKRERERERKEIGKPHEAEREKIFSRDERAARSCTSRCGTHHSCELAYFKPSTTVEYIRLPHPAKARGANAVVLDVNCFKDCLSAIACVMMCVMMCACKVMRTRAAISLYPKKKRKAVDEREISRAQSAIGFQSVFQKVLPGENTSVRFLSFSFFFVGETFFKKKKDFRYSNPKKM